MLHLWIYTHDLNNTMYFFRVWLLLSVDLFNVHVDRVIVRIVHFLSDFHTTDLVWQALLLFIKKIKFIVKL
jgi:hypothetical protein